MRAGAGFEPAAVRLWDVALQPNSYVHLPFIHSGNPSPHKLPIEGDNPTLRDSRIGVKKNQLADTLATSPLGYSPSFGRWITSASLWVGWVLENIPFRTGRKSPPLPGKPAFQRGNPYPLICRSPLAWQRGDKAIFAPTFDFARRKRSGLFFGHWTGSLHPGRVCPPAGWRSTTGTAQTHESRNLDAKRIVEDFCIQRGWTIAKYHLNLVESSQRGGGWTPLAPRHGEQPRKTKPKEARLRVLASRRPLNRGRFLLHPRNTNGPPQGGPLCALALLRDSFPVGLELSLFQRQFVA